MNHELGLFTMDFLDDLTREEVGEVVTAVVAIHHRSEDGEFSTAYRTLTSDSADNVALLLDALKLELQQP